MPDSCITGEGVKARIREKLLTEANLHTIIRLPDSTFHPATVPTNLLFFEGGCSTDEIWYYEHKLPINQKSYSKTKPIQFKEFEPLIQWWNQRTENDFAWKVNVKDLVDWDLDIKNPTTTKDELGNSKQHFSDYISSSENFNRILDEISETLSLSDHPILGKVLLSHSYLFRNEKFIEILKELILKEAFNGKLSEKWRNVNKQEPAYKLIERINIHKEELIKKGILKKVNKQIKNNSESFIFKIPENWVWSKLGDIVQHNAGKTLHKGKNTGVLKDYITTSNLYWGYFQLEAVKQINIEEKEFKRCTASKGDLLICEGGDVGRSAIWNYDYDIRFQNHIHRVRPYCEMSTEYIYYYMMYLHKSNLIKEYKKGMGIGNLSGTALASIRIPIPPVEEQIVIIEMVKYLMESCNSLVNEIESGDGLAQMLMRAVLNEAFETKDEACQD